MDLERIGISGGAVLRDAAVGGRISSQSFDMASWVDQGAVVGEASGRGRVLFVRSGSEEWALRHYRRGGLVRHLVADHYLWQGEERVRAFRELTLLRDMRELGLPVPRPVGARYLRAGPRYTADLLTVRIPETESLAARLGAGRVSGTDPVPIARGEWIEVGRTLRRFHDAGVDHADLNAHNILLGPVERPTGAQESSPDANVGVDALSAVWLVDFDRGVLRAPGRWREANLRRLARSVEKVAGGGDPSGWSALLDGYRAEPTG